MSIQTIKLTADEQIEAMEEIACATGADTWDLVREYLSESLHQKHGKYVSIEFNHISKTKKLKFVNWLKESE